jgi:squalene-associated FAD-dependent desaturase
VNPVVIAGGGVSGLAAGVDLASRGIPILLLERKPFAGGRAYSFLHTRTGDTVDNGQHVLIGGYERTLRFLGRIGTLPFVDLQPAPTYLFHHPSRGFQKLHLPAAPPPLHLLWGVMSSRLLTVSDRKNIIRAGLDGRRSQAGKLAELTISEWLDRTGQSGEARRSLWEPLAVSIMNERCERASAEVFVRALRQAFFGRRRDAALALPTVGLSRIFVDPAIAYIRERKGSVRFGAEVTQVDIARGRAIRVSLKSGSTVDASAVILALPPSRTGSMVFRENRRRRKPFEELRTFPVSPIVSIHLWFRKAFVDDRFFGVIGRRIQWVFRRSEPPVSLRDGTFVSAVISAAHDFAAAGNAGLVNMAMEDLRSVYPETPPEPAFALVIREKEATISCTPRTERLRPGAETPVPNLFLAGDWTATGLPATLESAVISGEKAAELAQCWLSQTGD